MFDRIGNRQASPYRREFLEIGFSSALSLSLAAPRASRSLAAESKTTTDPFSSLPRAKGVLFVFLTGGVSHVDTFDMKPDAPAEVRGSFAPIATNVPGIQLCEHLPQLAARTDRLAIVRTMHCSPSLGAHETGTHAMLTGINELPAGVGLYASRNDWPCFAAGLNLVRPPANRLPSGFLVPHLKFNGAAYCGQNGGFLGALHDPWLLSSDPNHAQYRGDQSLVLPTDVSIRQFDRRRAILRAMDGHQQPFESHPPVRQFVDQQTKACETLLSGRFAKTLDLSGEPLPLRDRYGRHIFGQTLLLARRVLQAGVPIAQANMGFAGQWDTHTSNCPNLKQYLLPPLDQAFSALLDDMAASGMLDEYLVVLTGEFGRTPKLGGNVGTPTFSPDGRDHWTQCFTSVFAGGGVRGGQTIGRSDGIGAFPITDAYTPADLGATIYQSLGVDPSTEIHDRLGRPQRLNVGTPMSSLFTAREV
ncbi:MAG: DUF1501 domain-containing protein [Planctomycetota bacterium]